LPTNKELRAHALYHAFAKALPLNSMSFDARNTW
jgi:hypothetical protein